METSGNVWVAVYFPDFFSKSDTNQDILRFCIPRVLVEKGKGKFILRLYMS